jgi:hypothetical protein
MQSPEITTWFTAAGKPGSEGRDNSDSPRSKSCPFREELHAIVTRLNLIMGCRFL